jgi:death-on-curing protein
VTKPVWLEKAIVLDVHAEQLSLFGGPEGLRDEGLLESALARPQNKFAYFETDPAKLAAAYAFGIARNNPLVDGNKRSAFAAIIAFLGLNGYQLRATPSEATAMILALAAGELSEEALGHWLASHIGRASG